jgi:hypothetical protein
MDTAQRLLSTPKSSLFVARPSVLAGLVGIYVIPLWDRGRSGPGLDNAIRFSYDAST